MDNAFLQTLETEITAGRMSVADALARAFSIGRMAEIETPAPDVTLTGKVKARLDRTNSRGVGTKEYRLAVVNGHTYWVDKAPGVINAEGYAELPVGTIVISIDKTFDKRGNFTTAYYAGVVAPTGSVPGKETSVLWEAQDWCEWKHVGTKPGNVHVLEHDDGHRIEVGE